MSRGIPPIIVEDVSSGADGSPGLTGDSLDDPECTSTAASAVTSIWNENEAASTQRLRSPKVRWKADIRAAPRMKERIAVRDLSQARDGVSTGREFAPRARKIVFPVWLLEISILGFEDGMESFELIERLTCIDTKHEYALYAPLSTSPEMKKLTIKTRSAHRVETSAIRHDVAFSELLVSLGGGGGLPLLSRGPSR